MDLEKAIKSRHSCRAFLPTPISDETIEKIVESARIAPSGKNLQPWKFVCIKTATESKDISQIMANFYIKNKDIPSFRQHASIFATAKILEECPAIILVFEDCNEKKQSRDETSILLSIGAAVEHMMLTATSLGLGCLWIGDTECVQGELLSYILNRLKGTPSENFINKGNRLVCAMALGEIGEPVHKTPRKELGEILTIINN